MKEAERTLYTPELEHDSCGIGFVANLKGEKSHKIIADAVKMLENMEHRGGCGCDPDSGDGAGILIQKPHEFFLKKCREQNIELPDFSDYGVGMVFFPADAAVRAACRELLDEYADRLGLQVLGYRQVPVNPNGLGKSALATAPQIEQVFIGARAGEVLEEGALERKLFVLRNYTSHQIEKKAFGEEHEFYVASMSTKVLVYKGQLRTVQLATYFPDLGDTDMASALALVHSRFSTNTFPKWKLAQPFRYLAHNGEINTIRGNVNKMKSKEALMSSDLFTDEELEMLLPVCDAANSDSANLDSLVELLVLGGRSLPHVMMMLIPEAWQDNSAMSATKKAFYKYHASMMEPWDGPASICFSDGKIVGATLDRNGLRPSRYCITDEGLIILASEAGALPVDPAKIVKKGRLQPGKMIVADLEQGKVMLDEEIKEQIASAKPYGDWIVANRIKLRELPAPDDVSVPLDERTLLSRQQLYGYTEEDLKVILGPMAENKTEPVGSMGADTPLAVLSKRSQHLSYYFKQLFAQVTNPPIDPIRERMVMSLFTRIGNSLNILAETPAHCKQIHISQPVLTVRMFKKLQNQEMFGYRCQIIPAQFSAAGNPGDLEAGIDAMCQAAESAIKLGYNILIISDRITDKAFAPIPTLMATAAVQHHLVRKRIRTKAGIIVEAGDAWETHHFATLIGYGASAVHPYMAFESLVALHRDGKIKGELSEEQAIDNYVHAIGYGLLKIMSKMGISTLQSYQASQIFEALGISKPVIDKCFTGTISRIGGLSFDDIAKEVLCRHHVAFEHNVDKGNRLDIGGFYQWKQTGEYHLLNPDTIHLLQHSTRRNNYALYKKYAALINDQTKNACTLRGLFDFKERTPIPLEEVEPKESIMKRFATGAMSFGSISHEAHTTLAIAMNRIGAKSNSGEGGEDESRYDKKANGDWERSAIKQVASGRFGVNSYYLANAEELQIKIAQGAKPGEGGQLPGHKVDEWIGRVRHSTPGVGLISPPPHHDIYSIEDLAQLIFDLKNANRHARINVKLVSEAGVGTIAAGVAKAKADVILIAGCDGGTGASPISSIRHAGVPWELGLAEAHQTLVQNNLRSRVVLQTDGMLRTGRDIAIAALLGAEEWGVSTAALIVEGCIMMRKCHLNTCPVGIATQDPQLRALFTGDPDHVVNLFNFLAEDLRENMAALGFRTVDEMIGQSDILKVREERGHWKLDTLDLSSIIAKVPSAPEVGLYKQMDQDHGINDVLDWKLLENALPALKNGEKVKAAFEIVNTDRATGTLLSHEISKKYKGEGLPEGTIDFKFIGSAGQSFGAFAAPGLQLRLEGEANDYFGKGLSGGLLAVYPHKFSSFKASENIIIGNVALYGAISGQAFINGMAGERFAVRNSGGTAVVEGVGDHGCEYMTGGTVVILGETGRNFAAGMSGGIAYVWDPERKFADKCNMASIDLEPLENEDVATLKALIEKHVTLTDSELGKYILADWDKALSQFIKVMPREYKAVLLKRKQDMVNV